MGVWWCGTASHHCMGAARPHRSLVCQSWVDAFLMFRFYLWFILWFRMITWCFRNPSRSINHVDLWSVMIYFIYDAATCSIAAIAPVLPWAPGHPVLAAGARCLLPGPQQEQGLAALPQWLMSHTSLLSLPPPSSWTTFAFGKLFSHQWTCTGRAVASPLVLSRWQSS